MLQQLKDEFRQLKVIDCGLWHEQVERIENTDIPKLSTMPYDVRYQRVKFCDKKTRDHMGCAHTSVRGIALQKIEQITAILLLQAESDSGLKQQITEIVENYRRSLNEIELAIIQADIKKSGLELLHAEICEKQHNQVNPPVPEELLAVERDIFQIIEQQKQINSEIKSLNHNTMSLIEDIESKVIGIR